MPINTESQPEVETPELINETSEMELAQNYSKALQAGDAAIWNALFHEDFMVWGLGSALDSLTNRFLAITVKNKLSLSLTCLIIAKR